MHTPQYCQVIQPLNESASYDAAIKENPDNGKQPTSGGRNKRSIAQWNKLWSNGRVLTIAFMDDLTIPIKSRIEMLIRQWEPSTNLTFQFVEGVAGDIRIATNTLRNQSVVGTDALIVAPDKYTLSLSTPPDHPEFDKTVLHEFGHALGLQHEHQHPKANIPWDKPKVYEYYKSNLEWTKEEVDFNLFKPLAIIDLFRGAYDKESIMHYKIMNELTLGDWEVGDNTRISKLDRRNLRRAYPK